MAASAARASPADAFAAPVRYRVAATDPRAHVFTVSCGVDAPDPAGQVFRLPAWIPGSYLIREFARHFLTVRGECAGLAVGVSKIAKDAWRAEPCAGPLAFIAEVYAYDLSVRAAYLDLERGYFNGPSVFVWPEGREHAACELEIAAPADEACHDWRVATTLSPLAADASGFGRYKASCYDELIDHPVELGRFTVCAFVAGGAPHEVAISGRHRVDTGRLTHDLALVCQTHIDLFGGAPGSPAPFERYLFLVLALGEGYGGLEHRSSTSLVCSRDSLPQPGVPKSTDAYRTFLGLASHEYFHAWNVKRIKPAAFLPYDLTRENYTRLLWAFEGVTSYYDDLALVRSGVITRHHYLELLGRAITTLLRTPARHVQSIADSSFDAWIKLYRADENAPNAITSYYNKGSLVALALDLTLRLDTRATLDDVMRALWKRYGERGLGVPEDGVEAVVRELAGRDLSGFFDAYVRGTEELPLASLLSAFGIGLHVRASVGASDKGGTEAEGDAAALWVGARFEPGAELRLKHAFRDGPATRAGLAAGDTIVAIDGVRATAERLAALLRSRRAGDRVEIDAFRRDELFTLSLELAPAPLDTCYLLLDKRADPAGLERREAWLAPLALTLRNPRSGDARSP